MQDFAHGDELAASSPDEEAVKRRNAKGATVESAADVARRTGEKPHGGEAYQRGLRNGRVAKEGRNILREWKRQNDYARSLRGEKEPEDVPSDDEGALQGKDEEKVVRRGGGMLDKNDLLKLAEELGMEGEGEDGEEDEEEQGENENNGALDA